MAISTSKVKIQNPVAMKKLMLLAIISFSIITQTLAQFSISTNVGMNMNIPKTSLVATSVSPSLGIILDYNFSKKYFIRTGIQQTAFSLDNGGQISQLSVPLYFGTSTTNNNFQQLAGFGYYLSFPNRFVDIDKQNYFTHGIGAFYEFRFNTTEKSFFGFGIDTKLDLASSGSFDLLNSSNFYITLGLRLGKK